MFYNFYMKTFQGGKPNESLLVVYRFYPSKTRIQFREIKVMVHNNIHSHIESYKYHNRTHMKGDVLMDLPSTIAARKGPQILRRGNSWFWMDKIDKLRAES